MKKNIIININTSEVAASFLVYNKDSQKPKVLYTQKQYIKFNKEINFDILKENTKIALNLVLEKIYNYIDLTGELNNVNNCYLFLSPPWIKKRFYQIKDENFKNFIADERYIENFISENVTVEQDSEIISSEIISVKANEYNTTLTNILGKKINKIEASLLDVQIKKEDKKFLEEIISNKFNLLNVTFSAFFPVFLSQIKSIAGRNINFSFLDFTGEIMEFGIYNNSEIKSIVNLQEGFNEIIRDIIFHKIVDRKEEAENIFFMYLKETLNDEKRQKIDKIIKKHLEQIKETITNQIKKVNSTEKTIQTFTISNGLINLILKDSDIFDRIIFLNKTFIKDYIDFEKEEYFNIFTSLEADYIYQ